jgi:hypothetical protein
VFSLGALIPLDARQDSCHIVRRAPPVLQNIQAKLASGVYVGVEHVADELDCGWLIWVLLFEVHDESECSVFEGSICWADDDCVPVEDQCLFVESCSTCPTRS